MKVVLLAFASGLVFGCGILLSGMANPAKILNFFDIAGSWDPSLAFVMGGALTIAAIGFRLVWRNARPLAADTFHVPVDQRIDQRLILGSALFGIGWGMAGFCPGGAIPALGLMRWEVFAFVAAMALGIALARVFDPQQSKPAGPAAVTKAVEI